jgi:hypothetical protein
VPKGCASCGQLSRKKSVRRISSADGFYFFGGRTLKRTIGRLVLDLTRLWLLRRRRCSLAEGENKAAPAQAPVTTIPMNQKIIQSRCAIPHYFDRALPGVKAGLRLRDRHPQTISRSASIDSY